jgi:putative heme degradation protein
MEAACRRALHFNTCSYASLKSILKNNLARIFHKASDFSRPTCVFVKNRLAMRPFSGSAAQQREIACCVKQKCRF